MPHSKPFLDLARVFGEALEGGHLAVVDDHVVAQHAHAGVAHDLAVRDHAAGDGAQLGGLERRAHLGLAEHDLLERRLEHADQGGRDVLGDLVDDAVRAHVDALGLGERGRLPGSGRTLKPMMIAVEAAASMTSDSLMPPTPEWMTSHLDLGVLDLEQRVAERLEAALHVGLDDEVEVEDLARGDAREDVVERERVLLGERLRLAAGWRASGPGRAPARSSLTTRQNSPATGSSSKPMISTGVDGPPLLSGSPRKSRMARTLPLASPATMASPTRMVPRLTSMVATTPRPGSTLRLDDEAAGRRVGVGLEVG